MNVIETANGMVKSWCPDIEDGAWAQAVDAANHPRVDMPVALMPDAHQGYGVPIGAVVPVRDALIPNAVGVDIGCGMCAAQTSLKVENLDKTDLARVLSEINKRIPMGFNRHEEFQYWEGFDLGAYPELEVIEAHLYNARYQLGTLGGGNHFIELQKDNEGYLWIMIHSGSRNLGKQIADFYHNRAVELCIRWESDLPTLDLAYLPIGEAVTAEYIRAMTYALKYAKANRKHMMDAIFGILKDELAWEPHLPYILDVHHNFASKEIHMDRAVWIHRKGATPAFSGQIGIIPGSMGTRSYIVSGKGDIQSYKSCSHGAGRRMGRREFMRQTELADAEESIEHVLFEGWKMDRKGNPEYSEAPMAYKDIDEVMENQKDLTEPTTTLIPLAVAKG